jgi:glycosyltransferase involved in cell wall biosynthesis
VLIPAHNVEDYIGDCLESVTGQIDAGLSVEIIIVDDCSTDGTLDICRSHAAARQGIRIITHDINKGVSAARNRLLDEARGKYIWFVDADDRMMPGALARLMKILTENDVDMVVCDYVREDGAIHPTITGPGGQVEEDTEKLIEGIFRNRRLHLWTKIFRRSLADDGIRFPEGVCFEDIAVLPRLLLRVKSYIHVPEAWIFYRSRPGSIITLLVGSGRSFDKRRNNDLAIALAGFKTELERTLPSCSTQTHMAIAHFLAREYEKMARRYLRSRGAGDSLAFMRQEMGRYLGIMESQSPVPFREVAKFYWEKRRLIRWLALRFYLAFALPPAKTREVMSRRR